MNPGASQRHEKLLTGRSVILKCQESPYQVKVYHHLYISTLSRQSFAQKHPGLVFFNFIFVKIIIWSKVKNSASSRIQLIVPVLSHDITKNLMGHRYTYRVPKYPKWTVRPIAFRVYDSIFLRRYTEIGKKENFLVQLSVPENLQFFGAGIHGTLTHSGFRKYISFGWPSLHSKFLATQSEATG